MLRPFPSRTLALYLARLFLTRAAAVLVALVVVLTALDLLGETGNILAHPGNGQAQVLHYLGLRLPQIVARFLPFSVLLGTLITLVSLNQNSEVIAMKAAGISAHQVLAPLVLAGLGVALLSFAFNERVVVRATAGLSAWQAVGYGPIPPPHQNATNVWVRDGEDILHASTVSGHGNGVRMTGLTIYDRRAGELVRIVRAPAAMRDPGDHPPDWIATDATVFDIASGTELTAPRYHFGSAVSPDQFTLADLNADDLPMPALRSAVGDLEAAGRPTGPLTTGLWHKVSGPLSAALMPLLAAVAGFGLARSGRMFLRAVAGMVLGFAYFIADNFGVAMGNLGAYPPLLAAWGPLVLFLLIGETVLVRTEE